MNRALNGLNLGGWLVIEKWITPSLFSGTNARNEFELSALRQGRARIAEHHEKFITKKDLSEVGIKDLVAVYFPHSYNFSGNLFLVSADNITPLPNFKSADAMKFIVSGGVTDLIQTEEEKKKT